jgi:hypothetical protein
MKINFSSFFLSEIEDFLGEMLAPYKNKRYFWLIIKKVDRTTLRPYLTK